MRPKVKTIIAVALPVQIVLVKWIGSYPAFVEQYYSEGLYPIISRMLRILFGWIPFSMGDIIYLALFVLAGRYVYRNWKKIKEKPLGFLKDIAVVLSIVYFAFHFLWGMNYYRQPITWKLGIEKEYTKEQLVSFSRYLIQLSNQYQVQLTGDSTKAVKLPYNRKEVFQLTKTGYGQLKEDYPYLEYKNQSLKSSLFSIPLSYMGYGGYLNPFSNEAQINGITPIYRMPTVSGHEVGHQLGYSAEDATNFIGFLVTSKNDDPYFKYTAYSHALGYCLSDLARKDEPTFKKLVEELNPGVKKNYQEVTQFWERYQNPMEPLFKSIFNTFLKANNQEEGIKSYNSVVGLLIGYHHKYGF
ncbi:DUF3810 domain-containing protein [Flagellimonas myxillae]|uniref:DUF3810 domain-containing protein n=1 Tax=Flagellimonas myxillae TaxID=2942214 RepID=UPI00201F165E|nr:DUF3810 domain-containing protein [Muricauda myxillae]MCL6265367.1 DUF3810 domain-containing protein [Muricauda myxillae]